MDLLLKFLLVTVLAVNCYSYDIIPDPELGPEEVELQDIGYIANDYYPHEYIEKVMSEVTSEELEQLKINHNQVVEKRIGTSPGDCKSSPQITYPQRALDESRVEYIVVQATPYLQHFEIQICDAPYGCSPEIKKGYIGCCQQQDELVEMTVLSVPVSDFNPSKPEGDNVQKQVYLKNAKCICQEYPTTDSTTDCSKVDHHLL